MQPDENTQEENSGLNYNDSISVQTIFNEFNDMSKLFVRKELSFFLSRSKLYGNFVIGHLNNLKSSTPEQMRYTISSLLLLEKQNPKVSSLFELLQTIEKGSFKEGFPQNRFVQFVDRRNLLINIGFISTVSLDEWERSFAQVLANIKSTLCSPGFDYLSLNGLCCLLFAICDAYHKQFQTQSFCRILLNSSWTDRSDHRASVPASIREQEQQRIPVRSGWHHRELEEHLAEFSSGRQHQPNQSELGCELRHPLRSAHHDDRDRSNDDEFVAHRFAELP